MSVSSWAAWSNGVTRWSLSKLQSLSFLLHPSAEHMPSIKCSWTRFSGAPCTFAGTGESEPCLVTVREVLASSGWLLCRSRFALGRLADQVGGRILRLLSWPWPWSPMSSQRPSTHLLLHLSQSDPASMSPTSRCLTRTICSNRTPQRSPWSAANIVRSARQGSQSSGRLQWDWIGRALCWSRTNWHWSFTRV